MAWVARWLAVGMAIVGGTALLAVGRYLAWRLRPPEERMPPAACRQHHWSRHPAAERWRCGRCGAERADCPHLTWELVPGADRWACRACEAVRDAAAWKPAASGGAR